MVQAYSPEIQQRLDAYQKAAEEATTADEAQRESAAAAAEAQRTAYGASEHALTAHRDAAKAARELIDQWTTGTPPQQTPPKK